MNDGYTINVASMLGRTTLQPFVSVAITGLDEVLTLTSHEAVDLAHNLLEAAAAAVADAGLFTFLREHVDASDEQSTQILSHMRLIRESKQDDTLTLTYLCANCGSVTSAPLTSLDTGTTFQCEECGHNTVVVLTNGAHHTPTLANKDVPL